MTTIDLVISPRRRAGFRLSFSGPGSWAEISPRQAVGLMRLQAQVQQSPQLLFPALTLLFGLKARHQRWLFDARFLRRKGVSEAELPILLEKGQALIDAIRWTGETTPGMAFIVQRFRRLDYRYGTIGVLLRRLWTRTVYQAPGEGLADLKFGEFMLSDKAYRDRDFLRLAAILYVPFQDGKRPAIDQNEIDTRSRQFAHLEPALVQLIILHYEACLRYLQRCFPRVFPEPSEDDTRSSESKGSWLDVAISMAKLDATKVGAIEELNVYLALKVLDTQIRQADELEEQLRKK